MGGHQVTCLVRGPKRISRPAMAEKLLLVLRCIFWTHMQLGIAAEFAGQKTGVETLIYLPVMTFVGKMPVWCGVKGGSLSPGLVCGGL